MWNDVNNFIDIDRAVHKKFNQNLMVVAQWLIPSKFRHCVGVCRLNGGNTRYLVTM